MQNYKLITLKSETSHFAVLAVRGDTEWLLLAVLKIIGKLKSTLLEMGKVHKQGTILIHFIS